MGIYGKKNSSIAITVVAIALFLLICFIAIQTQYYEWIAQELTGTGSVSSIKSVLGVLIMILSFTPCSSALAYLYVVQNFKQRRGARMVVLSLLLTVPLYIIFAWSNFVVNY